MFGIRKNNFFINNFVGRKNTIREFKKMSIKYIKGRNEYIMNPQTRITLALPLMISIYFIHSHNYSWWWLMKQYFIFLISFVTNFFCPPVQELFSLFSLNYLRDLLAYILYLKWKPYIDVQYLASIWIFYSKETTLIFY